MKAREGDLLESLDGNIFDVKGLVHPPGKIIAFIRFTPDFKGERRRGKIRYKKVYPLHERYALLQEKFPQYLVFDPIFNQWLCEVPTSSVKKHYDPRKHLNQLRSKRSLMKLEDQALKLAQLLQKESGLKWRALGVSGSLLVGLHTPTSDIDLIVYGSKNCYSIFNTLKSLVKDDTSNVKTYNKSELKSLFDFRSKDTIIGFEHFVRAESRKVLQGKFLGRDYFIRCIKEWNEIDEQYGFVNYEPSGEAKITATIADDSQMIFTPCTYPIEDVETLEGKKVEPLCEIASFRGRFCEQAKKGEKIIAHGMIEHLQKTGEKDYFRLLLGNRPSDFMILSH